MIQVWWLLFIIVIMTVGLGWQTVIIDKLQSKTGYRPTGPDAPPPERVENMRSSVQPPQS